MEPSAPPHNEDVVLIVEDDAALGGVVASLLRRLGYEARLVTTVEAAIEELRHGHVLLVLLDLGLPGVCGHALLRALELDTSAPPVIVMSGSGALEDVIEVLRRRAVDFVRKPFRPEDLSASIDRALARRASDLGRAAEAAPAPAPEPASRAAAPDQALSAQLFARVEQLAGDRGLTTREREVLQLALLGRGHEEVGTALGISARTAKFHLANLLAKLGAESRADLLRVLL